MQWRELIEALKQLRENNVHTALETNGTSSHLSEIQEHVDYLMMDFKHYDKDALRNFTGVEMEPLLQNYKYLCGIGRQLHVRIPLIHHVNTEEPEKFAKLLSAYDTTNAVFEFLPYHEYGKEKWKTEYKMKDGFVNAEQIEKFHKAFESYHLKIIRT